MLVLGGEWNACVQADFKHTSGIQLLESQTKFVNEPLMETYWIPDVLKGLLFKTSSSTNLLGFVLDS